MSAIVSAVSIIPGNVASVATAVAQSIVGSGNGLSLVQNSSVYLSYDATGNPPATFTGGANANMTIGSVGSGAQPRLDSGAVISTGVSMSFTLRSFSPIFSGTGSVDLGQPGPLDDDVFLSFAIVPDDGTNKLHLELAFGSNGYLTKVGDLSVNDSSFVRINGVDIFFVPGTTIPIGFNTVYPLGYSAPPLNINGYNHDYYVDNAAITYTGYNGYAQVSYDVAVTAGAVYALEFGVADVGDGLLDSALIIGQLLCTYDAAFVPTPTPVAVLQRPL